MLSSKSSYQSNNSNNQHRRQYSEGLMWSEKGSIYKDDDRLLIQQLLNEYLLGGSIEVLDLIRNSSTECFEALVDFIWQTPAQTESNPDELIVYNQRSSLLSSSNTNVYRRIARRRFAIVLIEIFKLLGTQTSQAGRFDLQRQQRLIGCPSMARSIINFEPDIHGLSCLSLASIILINPNLIHNQLHSVFEALKYAASHLAKTNCKLLNKNPSFETPSTFAVSIYSLFYLLYILYPNNLRSELKNDFQRGVSSNERSQHRLGIEKVLLGLFSHFKLHPSIISGSVENEKAEQRWQNESWQQIIANGDRYVVSDDTSFLSSNEFRKGKDEDRKSSSESNRFEIGKIIGMCNEYAENVLHLSETKCQIENDSTDKIYSKKISADNYSNYSDAYCQTFEQQWHTTIQNGQRNLARIETSTELHRRQTNTNGQKKDSNQLSPDHHVHSKVQLQLDMLDCNYEQDKREFYAQSIRDSKKNFPMAEIDRKLREKENIYAKFFNKNDNETPPIHEIRSRAEHYHQLNGTFYNSLSATQVVLKTGEDDHWQKVTSFKEKQTKLENELNDLQQTKINLESEVREIQRRLFETKPNGKQSSEMNEMIDKVLIELSCVKKKHQILHDALVQIKLKPISSEKLILIHERNAETDSNLDEKRIKFRTLKESLENQKSNLTVKRTNFHQTRAMNTHKINVIRRQIDSVRVCQTQILTKHKTFENSQ